MAQVEKAAFWAIVIRVIERMGEKVVDKGGEAVEKALIEKPRVFIDFLIDRLKFGGSTFSPRQGKAAELKIKRRIKRADNHWKPCSEDKLYTVFCKILELDKNEDGTYDLNFPHAKERFVELGSMRIWDFDQSINGMIDAPISGAVKHGANITKQFTKDKVKQTKDWYKKKRDEGDKRADSMLSKLGLK